MSSADLYRVCSTKKSTQSGIRFETVGARASPHFIAGQGLYTTTDGERRLPTEVPTYNALHFTEHEGTSHYAEFNWIHPAHPFLPLVPLRNVFHDELLNCLDYTDGQFPAFRDQKQQWRLALNIAKDWDVLEIGLRRLVRGLIVAADPGELMLSEHFSMWTYPAHYGYKRLHSSSESLQVAAAASRDAFLPLIATGTLALSCLERRKTIDPAFLWRDKMIKNSHIHPEWLSCFERSYATGKSVRRVGGILDASTPGNRSRIRGLISLYRALNVSVLIHWGAANNFPSTYLRSILADEKSLDPRSVDRSWAMQRNEALDFAALVPSSPELDTLGHNGHDVHSETYENMLDAEYLEDAMGHDSFVGRPGTTLESLGPKKDKDLDSVMENSGQLDGETWEQFFARRAERRQSLQESPLQRQSRLDRETVALSRRCPGKKGPSIWYWVKRGTLRVRTLLTRKQHPDYWEEYGSGQKKYDGWSNCWDICSEFGDFDEEEIDEDCFDSPVTSGGSVTGDVSLTVSEPDAEREGAEEGEIEEESSTNNIRDTADDLQDSARGLRTLMPDNDYCISYLIEDLGMAVGTVAYERYGLTGDPVDLGPSGERTDWETALKLLGNGKWRSATENRMFQEDPPTANVQAQLTRHLYLIVRCNPNSFQTIPSLDLADPSNFIHSRAIWEFAVRKVVIDREEWYMLTERGDFRSAATHLLIRDPVSVVQVVRCNWGTTVVEVAESLVDYGVQFHILRRGRKPDAREAERQAASRPARLNKSVLGFRDSDYKADVHDLRGYEAARDRFFRTTRGRAAVMAGGIIARLAREVVPDADVVHGPDPDLVFRTGRCFVDTPEYGYWDDELTPEEIDLICGVYIVEKVAEHSGSVSQAAHRSWWPRPGAFEAGGLNLDFWSRDCEKWFQHRANECASKFNLMSASQWRRAMQMQHNLRQTPTNNQAITARFLEAIIKRGS
ncbi:hypothetical protein AAF712_014786 [Marasmius tenuissimus]|uniref:Uncharacterized protein n=1 Tax=Marasmius tenuissimus TaxID=585030 RepID=A0ABR2ZDJ2_9AGAR